MAAATIHQAIHGYREGHRLLSSSISLSTEASRAMLVLSDLSGPSMHNGFDQYLTGYPMPGTDIFVFARTWYAPEMQRPGCVWTHSLLIPRECIHISSFRLLASFRRPQLEGVELAATAPIVLDDSAAPAHTWDGLADRPIDAAVVGAVLGQPRPVIIAVESAAQLEPAILRLWDELWPAAKAGFSFCTGALAPRSVAGALLDVQAVPRAAPSSQFRRVASAALILDLRAPTTPEAWVELVLQCESRNDTALRSWMEAAAGAEASRTDTPSLMPIFGQWYAGSWSAPAALATVLAAPELEPVTRARLVGMVLNRAGADEGVAQRRELLQELCGRRDLDLSFLTSLLKEQTLQLFEESRSEGRSFTISLLGAQLTNVGEQVLRTAVLALTPSDVKAFGDAQAHFLPTIVRANPVLAQSPILWNRAESRAAEVLSQLSTVDLGDHDRVTVIDAILTSEREAPVGALLRFGGKLAILRALAALADGQLKLSWSWRSYFSAHSDVVIEWLESQPSPMPNALELGTQILSPTTHLARLTEVWQAGAASLAGNLSPRVAAFGLALALADAKPGTTLLAVCFQPVYEAAVSSRLHEEEWDWLRDLAPSLSWYRDWDKCERLAAALARLLARQEAPLETVFGIIHSGQAIRKLAAALKDKDTRPYLKLLRKAAAALPDIGTNEQRAALLEDC